MKYLTSTLFVLFLILGASYSFGQPEVGFDTYSNSDYGYSIKYPEKHKIEKRNTPRGEKVRFNGRGLALMVVTDRNPKLKKMKNKDLVYGMKRDKKRLEKSLKQVPRDQTKLRGSEIIDINGRKALFIEGKEIGRNILVKMLVVKKGDTLYMVTSRMPPKSWDVNGKAIMEIFKNFEIH